MIWKPLCGMFMYASLCVFISWWFRDYTRIAVYSGLALGFATSAIIAALFQEPKPKPDAPNEPLAPKD